MSDKSISLVFSCNKERSIVKLKERLMHYLISNKIIAATTSACVLSDDVGYAPGENCDALSGSENDQWKALAVNGMEVITGRHLYAADELIDIHCPNCNSSLIEASWSEAIGEWAAGSDNAVVNCNVCGNEHIVTSLVFDPIWGFGELGLTFWNWNTPFKQDELARIEVVSECSLTVIYNKV